MHSTRKRLTFTALALCCLMLSACGFQLRGAGGTSLPDDWRHLHLVTGNPNAELSRELSSRFSANGVNWVSREEADHVVELGPERFSQYNLSLDAQARAAEIQLTLSAEFSVRDAEGKVVMASSGASVAKQMGNDPRNVVGKTEEIRILKKEMRAELSQQILRRIGYYATSAQP